MQAVLVAGGAGFIGSHLCEYLLQKEYNVLCVDNFLTGSKENVRHLVHNPHFVLMEHDIILPLPDSVSADFVFHLASPASPNHHSSISYHALPMQTMMVNTVGTQNLLEFAKKCRARFLFASTSEVYGDPLEHPQNEKYRGNVSTTGPRSVYDESKRFGETLVSYYYRTEKIDTRIARVFNTFGPRMATSDMRMVVSFVTEALEGKPLTVFGDGKQTRCLCYISDLVEGLIKLMFAQNAQGEIINLGSTQEHSVLEYATIIKKITGSRSEIVFKEELPTDDPKRRCPDITKAKKMLDWEPKINLEDGLRRMIDSIIKI